MKTGLFFGSFNPIHIGHLAIANYMVEFTDIDEVWFVVSPHNPLKKKSSLLQEYLRYDMVELAVKDDKRFMACNIEMRMPQPSYTIDTLTYLKESYPDNQFVLIMGSDVLPTFNKWKNHECIIKEYQRYIYPRPGFSTEELIKHENTFFVDAPNMEISSSFIRQAIKDGKDIKYFLPERVYKFIKEKYLYEDIEHGD